MPAATAAERAGALRGRPGQTAPPQESWPSGSIHSARSRSRVELLTFIAGQFCRVRPRQTGSRV